jgi:hypothetical protein
MCLYEYMKFLIAVFLVIYDSSILYVKFFIRRSNFNGL